MIRLRWHVARGVSARARRGAMTASVYLRRDGRWGWQVGRLHTPQTGDDGLVMVQQSPWQRGVAFTRRDAQRACLQWVRVWHRGVRVWPRCAP